MWVESDSGARFAAPDLVLHYIDTHAYRPPPESVDAVTSGRRIDDLRH
jgi:hypothetical protein